jgi:hypothetical protein
VADIVFLTTIVAFFLVCVGYVWACGRIIGNETVIDAEEPSQDDAIAEMQDASTERAA